MRQYEEIVASGLSAVASGISGINKMGAAEKSGAEMSGAENQGMRKIGNSAGNGSLVASHGMDRARVEAVVETLATLPPGGDSLAEVAHDARNMVTALGLYCDLLEEPGVLNDSFRHYGKELRLVTAASRRLVEKMVALDSREAAREAAREAGQAAGQAPGLTAEGGLRALDSAANAVPAGSLGAAPHWGTLPATPIKDLAAELTANRNLLAALAGPAIALGLEIEGGALPVQMTGEDLTRILVNLVKNAAEAMPAGGTIRVGLRERTVDSGGQRWLLLAFEDSGPGFASATLDKVFEPGFSTRMRPAQAATPAGIPAAAAAATPAGGHRGAPGPALGRVLGPAPGRVPGPVPDRAPGRELGRVLGRELGRESTVRGAAAEWPVAHRGLGLSITRSIVEAAGGAIQAVNREGRGSSREDGASPGIGARRDTEAQPVTGARLEIALPERVR